MQRDTFNTARCSIPLNQSGEKERKEKKGKNARIYARSQTGELLSLHVLILLLSTVRSSSCHSGAGDDARLVPSLSTPFREGKRFEWDEPPPRDSNGNVRAMGNLYSGGGGCKALLLLSLAGRERPLSCASGSCSASPVASLCSWASRRSWRRHIL